LNPHKLPNSLESQVGRRVSPDDFGIECVMSLPHKNRRHSFAPGLLDSRENSQLVIHHHVMLGWKASFDVFQLLLLVNIHHHPARYRLVKPGAMHLIGLENNVSIRQQRHGSKSARVTDRVQGTAIQAVGEFVIYQEG